eukprot:SAG31_NODE_805_length_11970_cov_3.710793_14_plen_134_part_00
MDEKSYSYILTLTHTFNAKLSAFIENQGIKSDFYADQIIRGGAAYLVSKDFQVDVAFLTNFKDTPSRQFVRLGISYRLDMHANDQYIEKKGKAGRTKKRKEKILNLMAGRAYAGPARASMAAIARGLNLYLQL